MGLDDLLSRVCAVMNDWIIAINSGDGKAASRCHNAFCGFKMWDEFRSIYKETAYGTYLMERFEDMDDLEYHVSLGDGYPAHVDLILSKEEFEGSVGK